MAIVSEVALLDTNILVYAMNKDAEQHAVCRDLVERAFAQKIEVCLAPQILFEYFAVVTSAKQMTRPLSALEAVEDIERLPGALPLVHPTTETVTRSLNLVRVLGHTGRHVFDIALAATMLENGVKTIYTFDERFSQMPGLVAIAP
jgi:uncharacterized protein